MTNVLYITRNGLLEPLGQSQIWSYLRLLSQTHDITLITNEKIKDWNDTARMEKARADCTRHGIIWFPRKFRSGPRFIAPALSLLSITFLAYRWARGGKNRLIHARSYLPAGVAWAVWRLTGTPFIFDMRAFWPEEMITAGRLKRGSIMHRLLQGLERRCLRDAAGVVSLTHTAVDHLRKAFPQELQAQRIVVIPTCADLARFKPMSTLRGDGPVVHGCIGSVLSGWFSIDWLAAWIEMVAACDPSARFDVVTRDDSCRVRFALDPDSKLSDRLSIQARNPSEMPQTVSGHDVTIMFYAGGEISELARSPTRMAEVLGCGLPVVANRGVGDVAGIIEQYRVGVLVEGSRSEQLLEAIAKLEKLRADPNLADRCRAAAETVFSLEAGVKVYHGLYLRIVASKL